MRPIGDAPFMVPPLMSARQARDISRAYAALAEYLTALGVPSDAQAAERRSAWWLAFMLDCPLLPISLENVSELSYDPRRAR